MRNQVQLKLQWRQVWQLMTMMKDLSLDSLDKESWLMSLMTNSYKISMQTRMTWSGQMFISYRSESPRENLISKANCMLTNLSSIHFRKTWLWKEISLINLSSKSAQAIHPLQAKRWTKWEFCTKDDDQSNSGEPSLTRLLSKMRPTKKSKTILGFVGSWATVHQP